MSQTGFDVTIEITFATALADFFYCAILRYVSEWRIYMENVIEVNQVTKSFGNATVLKEVSVSFEKGKIHGLIGRNGSGKTMLMKCICGFVPVTSGTITVNGKVIGKDVDVPDNLGAIIETPGFLYNYSGYNNLKFLASINKKIDKQAIKDSIELVGLDPNSKKHVGKYSLGMRQRLGLAQAIMENPQILILDEPMNGLDKTSIQMVTSMLNEYVLNGGTLLMTSHIEEQIKECCKKVFEFDNFHLVCDIIKAKK